MKIKIAAKIYFSDNKVSTCIHICVSKLIHSSAILCIYMYRTLNTVLIDLLCQKCILLLRFTLNTSLKNANSSTISNRIIFICAFLCRLMKKLHTYSLT